MLITDKMIDDIFDFFSGSSKSAKGFLKEHFKEMGYQVEELEEPCGDWIPNDMQNGFIDDEESPCKRCGT